MTVNHQLLEIGVKYIKIPTIEKQMASQMIIRIKLKNPK